MGLRISWTDLNSAEDGHKIYRSTSPMDAESLPAELAIVGPDVTHYDDGSVVEGVTYFYRVSAYVGALERVSSEISISVPYSVATPTGLSALSDNDTPKVDLYWADNSFDEDEQRIYRSSSPMDPMSLPAALATISADLETYQDTSVTAGSTYYYRVSSVRNGVEEISDEIEVNMASIPSDFVAFYTVSAISGSTLVDQSANGYDATINGAVFSGGYLVHDGVNDYIDLATLLAAIAPNGQGTFVIKGRLPSGGRLYLGVGDNSSDEPYIQISMYSSTFLYAYKQPGASAGVNNFTVRRNDTYPEGADYVLAVVQDAAGAKLYLNGSELVINQITGTPSDRWFDDNPNLDTMRLASLDRTSELYYPMDFVYLYYYARRLSGSEIANFT